MTTEAPLTIKTTEDKKDEELVHELFKVFPKVFGKKEPRDEYFFNILAKGDTVQINDIVQAPVVLAVTNNPEIVKRAILRYRGFTVNNETIKQNTYQRGDTNTLIIKDLPLNLQPEQVIALFSEGPKPISARPDQHNNWFINFATEEESKLALSASKSMTYEGKPVRVNVKRENHVRNHNYEGRPSPMRQEYTEVSHLPMSPVMSHYPPLYYSPVMPNQYYPAYPMAPYAPYPVDMSMAAAYGYYQQVQQPQQPYAYPSPTGGNYQNRRPGRGAGPATTYNNNGNYNNSGRGPYTGPRREKSPRSGQQFFSADASATTGPDGEQAAHNAQVEAAPASATTTTQSESEVAPSGASSEEATPTASAVETKSEPAVDGTQDASKADNHDSNEKKHRNKGGDNEHEGRKQSGNNAQKRTNTNRSNNGSGAQNNNTQGAAVNNNNRNKNPRDRNNNNGTKDNNEPKKEKPRAPPVKFTMETDFPVFVDQKPASSTAKSFDYANAVKKAQAPAPIPSVPEPVTSSSAAPIKEEIVAPQIKAAPRVAEPVQPTPAPVVEMDQPLSFGSFEAALAAPATEAANTNAAPDNSGAKRSFIDALRQPKK